MSEFCLASGIRTRFVCRENSQPHNVTSIVTLLQESPYRSKTTTGGWMTFDNVNDAVVLNAWMNAVWWNTTVHVALSCNFAFDRQVHLIKRHYLLPLYNKSRIHDELRFIIDSGAGHWHGYIPGSPEFPRGEKKSLFVGNRSYRIAGYL